MKARQAVITKPFAADVREVDLPDPADNQILVAAEVSAVSPGTELAVYTGTHQWLLDPNLPDWKFPFRSGYSAAGTIVAVGKSNPELTRKAIVTAFLFKNQKRWTAEDSSLDALQKSEEGEDEDEDEDQLIPGEDFEQLFDTRGDENG